MKSKVIGIVLEKMELCRIIGYLAILQSRPEFDEFYRITINNEITEIRFEYYPKAHYYSIFSGTKETAFKVGRELKKLGIDGLQLLFNDEYCEIPEE